MTTATEIKFVENNFETLKSIEVNLEKILIEELYQGLVNDIFNAV